eukprot:5054659-Pleurochrysis_carterae.AAC.6
MVDSKLYSPVYEYGLELDKEFIKSKMTLDEFMERVEAIVKTSNGHPLPRGVQFSHRENDTVALIYWHKSDFV